MYQVMILVIIILIFLLVLTKINKEIIKNKKDK